ncbi:MAG: UdgX family uracil-DNA binding protein [Sphingosinicella sp.]|uniref:UdgX family uracil-DNA binding protein n=1 Tax=Sphingosinicella sp. TaxID=1917971 RepID=UPI00403804ED
MRAVRLAASDDFEGWRDAARALAMIRVAPEEVVWQVAGEADLFEAPAPAPPALPGAFSVPRAFLELAEAVVCHRDPERFALLYAFLCRLRDRPRAMEDGADPLLRRLELMAKAVRRDMHKMRAFLRFREVADDGGPRYVAWFEPEHHIVRANAGFFVRRFASMRWSILTPHLSLHWDGAMLTEGPGASKAEAPDGDPAEAVWKTYYAAIFNPARVKVGAMLKEMPRKYWKNMPETALVPQLLKGAQARETEMVAAAAARVGDNVGKSWASIRDEAMGCTRCELYKCGTQTVFGEGPLDARIVFVGEQPGDQEDLAGKPFVGPAGQLLDRALIDAGVDRKRTYVTNAVKHFKFVRRGKRRIHDKPDGGEIAACRWWLQQELALIKPPLTVALGATAARALFGKVVTISGLRGRPHELPEGGETWVTVHPSFLLRVRDDKEAEYARFVEDLRTIGKRAKALA